MGETSFDALEKVKALMAGKLPKWQERVGK